MFSSHKLLVKNCKKMFIGKRDSLFSDLQVNIHNLDNAPHFLPQNVLFLHFTMENSVCSSYTCLFIRCDF